MCAKYRAHSLEYSDKLAYVQVVTNWQNSIAQMCTLEEYSPAFLGDVMSQSEFTTLILFVAAIADKDENGNVIEDEFSELPFFSQHFARYSNHSFPNILLGTVIILFPTFCKVQ